jgi:adenosylcobinamide-GDP ribazoletransferase
MSQEELPLEPGPEAPRAGNGTASPSPAAETAPAATTESARETADAEGDAGADTASEEVVILGEEDLSEDDVGDIEEEDEDAEAALTFGGLYVALSFLTRLPLGLNTMPVPGSLARAMGMFPLVGVVIGGIGAAVYALAHVILPAGIAALLALAATILATGGLHEDGLADTADGFGGGADRERKLVIMRDSRIGTFGVLAIGLSLALRATALAEIGGSLAVGGALVASHALARGAIPVAMQALMPARSEGLGAIAGQPSAMQTGIAITLAVIVAALALPASAALAALAGATIGCIAVVALAEAQIGGHTGDVLGAAEQCAETLGLLGALAAL